MTGGHGELWLQVSAGQGPVECAWAVVKVMEQIQNEASAACLGFKMVEIEPGPEPGTAHSVLVSIAGAQLEAFAASWSGTVQWTAHSPYRPDYKRKNWFVRIDAIKPVEETLFTPRDVHWETMRASGPGGQHVNRTESAVRVTHLPTGLQATAAEERSQHRNRKLALARLAQKLDRMNTQRRNDTREKRWRAHRSLERGNPVRVLRDEEK